MKLEGNILGLVYLLLGILGIAILYGIVTFFILCYQRYFSNNNNDSTERLLPLDDVQTV